MALYAPRSGITVSTRSAIAVATAVWLCLILVAQSAEETGSRVVFGTVALLSLVPALLLLSQFPIGVEVVSKEDFHSRASLGAFWLAGLVGSLFSIEPFTAAAYLGATIFLTLVCGHLWYLSVEGVESGLRLYAVFGALCLVGLTLVFGYETNERLGSFRNPNGVGLLCFGCAVIALAIRSLPVRIMVFAAAVVLLTMTGSRTSTLGLVAAMMVYSYPRWRRSRLPMRVVTGALVLVGLIAGYVYWDDVWREASDALLFDDPYRGLSSGFTGRDVLWRYALQLFYDNPIWGVGFRLHERYFDMSNPDIALPGSAHNGYLAALAELGLTGAIPLFVWIACRVRIIVMAPRRGGIGDVVLPFVVGYLFIGLFERFLINLGNPTSVIFLLLLVRPAARAHFATNDLPTGR